MTVKIHDNYNHVFRHSKYNPGNFQKDFIIFDIETNEKRISETQKELTFKLASFIFIKNFEIVKKGYTWYIDEFWRYFYNFIQESPKIYCINNNIGFDIRASNAFQYLNWFDFEVSKNFYFKGRTLILPFRSKNKENYKELLFLDMQNYFPFQSVKNFGEVIGLEKLEINFDTCSDEELEIYALRDVEIVWVFFKQFMDFLIENKLVSRLKPTISSLALTTYRTRFHKNKKIFIHNCLSAIKLEKESYRGGISDVFLKGVEVFCYYIDINSMYPFIMKYNRLPARLITNIFESNHSQKKLKQYLNKCINSQKYCCIANITYSLNKGYVLNRKDDIICNLYGDNINGSFCQPELEYIIKNGQILKIHQLAVYETELLFDKYVDFFYEIKKVTKGTVRDFTKRFLNTLYGKWGQLKEQMLILNVKDLLENYEILEDNEKKIYEETPFAHISSILGEGDIYKVNNKLYFQKRSRIKSFDSFIAISSYITSLCRTYLLQLKEMAEPNNEFNVFYCDTDSLFLNERGYKLLLKNGIIGENLGQLKLEGKGKALFNAPKDYIFNNKLKCKGIKKNAIKLTDNSYLVEEFESLNKAIKNGNLDKIIITEKIKTLSREYNKGIVLKNGVVIPFTV